MWQAWVSPHLYEHYGHEHTTAHRFTRPDAEGLQRARMNAVNALRAEPQTQVRLIANAGAVAAALDQPNEQADALTYLCPNTLAHLQREAHAPLQVLDAPAVLVLARLQQHGWAYIRS